ncbi:MAG: Mlc titration factor A [Proteobacteria bacterium SW_6_67_9]|nr:MAG: Mlc titration factor A [Proteobacteria bacterium SW_6_67_9]
MGQWSRNWRRNRILRRHGLSDRDWESLIQHVPAVARYDTRTRRRLRELVTLFLYEKSIEAAGGLELSDSIRQSIALQACLPILGLGLEWYAGWRSVVVYPGDFHVQETWTDDDGVVHELEEVRAGEAWPQGPVIVSWAPEDIESPAIVIHEFAHKLDMLNGAANGMPPLHNDMAQSEWTHVFARAYEDFTARERRGEALPFDAYAATDAAEFFAVASEVFLLDPDRVRDAYPRVYTQLAAFYCQHPRTL